MEIGLGSGFDVVHAMKIVQWKKKVRGQKWKQVAWLNRVITAGHFVCACAKIRLISSPNSIFTRSDKNTNFGGIFSHFTLKYVCLTIHKLTGKGRKFLKTNCKFKIGCGIKYIFAGKTGNIWMST